MATKNAFAKLEKLGYDAQVAHSQENKDVPTIYRVEGFGLSLHVAEDDKKTIDSLVRAHAERE